MTVFCFLSLLIGCAIAFAAVETALTLRRIAHGLETARIPGPPGPAGIPGPMGAPGKDAVLPPHLLLQPPPPSGSHGMSRVMRLENGEWVAGEFVRDGSPAFKKAYDTPGLALMPANGSIELGEQ